MIILNLNIDVSCSVIKLNNYAVAGDRPNRKNVLVIFTDGQSTNEGKTIAEAQRLKQKAHIIVVQIGTWFRPRELNGRSRSL